jgi:hypothetical protein
MKYVNSIFTPDQIGRLGGVTFGKNKNGVYMKMYQTPVNQRSTSQQDVRGFFGTASKAWAALTDAQRTAYDDVAVTIEYVKKGITYTLTGFQLFMKLNRNLQDIGQPFYQDISQDTLVSPPGLTTSTVDIVTTPGLEDISLNIPAALDANTKAIVYATPVLKSSRKPRWQYLRIITTIDHTFISGGSIKAPYIAEFGAMPNTGGKAGFAIMPVNIACGLSNTKVYMTAIGTV